MHVLILTIDTVQTPANRAYVESTLAFIERDIQARLAEVKISLKSTVLIRNLDGE